MQTLTAILRAPMLLKYIENQLQQKDDRRELCDTLVKQWRFNDT